MHCLGGGGGGPAPGAPASGAAPRAGRCAWRRPAGPYNNIK